MFRISFEINTCDDPHHRSHALKGLNGQWWRYIIIQNILKTLTRKTKLTKKASNYEFLTSNSWILYWCLKTKSWMYQTNQSLHQRYSLQQYVVDQLVYSTHQVHLSTKCRNYDISSHGVYYDEKVIKPSSKTSHQKSINLNIPIKHKIYDQKFRVIDCMEQSFIMKKTIKVW